MQLKNFDYILLLTVILIACFGAVVIYSASFDPDLSFKRSFAFKQIAWILIGCFLCLVMAFIDYRFIGKISFLLYFFIIGLLVLVIIKGSIYGGAQRWLAIGTLRIQPSEFAKIIIILVLAKYLSWDNSNKHTWRYIFFTFLISIVPLILIVKQPDLGTALVFMPTIFILLFVSGARLKYLFILMLIGILSLPLGWFALKDYQKARILVFLNPNEDPLGSGYTVIQSKIAVGSGGLMGQGWLGGMQTRLKFLPERHTDFIFSVIGEEWGFIGALFVFSLFIIIFKRGLKVAELAKDLYGKLVAVGIVVMIFSHVIINIGMTIGVMPITGLPLPFITYGGSIMITMMVSVGILENIYGNRFMFS